MSTENIIGETTGRFWVRSPAEVLVKHFSEALWADFVRNNVVSPSTKMEMQQHIDDGCKKCAATLETWQSVLAIAKAESDLTPPEDIVRVAKSQFAAVVPEVSHGIRLLFDSNLQPVTAGVRGSVSARQFLYETDDYYIDLRLEPRREADRACLVGQVLNRAGKDRVAHGVAVRLQEGKLPVAETTTNQFGEFQIEFDAAEDLCVSIGAAEEEHGIVLPLYEVHLKPVKRKGLD
jgi:hypothetical protein